VWNIRLPDLHYSVGRLLRNNLTAPARPVDIDPIYLRCSAQTEMEAQVALREIAASAAHFVDLRMSRGRDLDPRPDCATVRYRSSQLENNPVPWRVRRLLQERWRFVLIVYRDLNRSIIIDIAECRAARRVLLFERRTGFS
jgi:hypothetical protein